MGVIEIPIKEIDFHHMSYADPNGRLFWWQGQLYRAINLGRTDFFNKLFQSGVVQDLVEKGLLVETELTDLSLSNYGLVLRHRTIPFVSYAHEWCAAMLKDAAITTINIEMELAQHGLTLQDAHPWNVLFHGPQPLYVDFGSIVPAQADTYWPAYDEFCRFFLYPLHLMSQGYGRIARWLLHDDQGVLKSDLVALTRRSSLGLRAKGVAMQLLLGANRRMPSSFRPGLKKGFVLAKSMLFRVSSVMRSRLDFLQQVRQEVEGIAIPSLRTEWSEYYDHFFPTFSPSDEWTAKHISVHRALSDLRPDSLLDIGSNRGWYSQLAALQGSRVVAFDVDEVCVTKLYYDSKDKKLPILPLVMDFRNPSPGRGLCNQSFAPAIERLKCDMVLALALVHHLVFKQQLNFDQIVDGLSVFSKRSLLVEFIPRDDRYVREWWSERFSWYTLNNFIDALKKVFPNVRILPSYPEPRVLLLCGK